MVFQKLDKLSLFRCYQLKNLPERGTAFSCRTSFDFFLSRSGGVLLGCYADKLDRDLTGTYYDSIENDVDTCLSFCSNAGFLYAGLQYSTLCFCDNTFGGKFTKSKC